MTTRNRILLKRKSWSPAAKVEIFCLNQWILHNMSVWKITLQKEHTLGFYISIVVAQSDIYAQKSPKPMRSALFLHGIQLPLDVKNICMVGMYSTPPWTCTFCKTKRAKMMEIPFRLLADLLAWVSHIRNCPWWAESWESCNEMIMHVCCGKELPFLFLSAQHHHISKPEII